MLSSMMISFSFSVSETKFVLQDQRFFTSQLITMMISNVESFFLDLLQ